MKDTINELFEKSSQGYSDFNTHDMAAINQVMNKVDQGELRVCENIDGVWQTNDWIKKAILLFSTTKSL
jgi:tetrahydrodipicolinate N-succinyltransferase